jgi:hypothetical protein
MLNVTLEIDKGRKCEMLHSRLTREENDCSACLGLWVCWNPDDLNVILLNSLTNKTCK